MLVILGPTATGKSDLAVVIARKYNGEVISADSRQVYTGLNIGTGKITKKEMCGVPHYMLDVVSPNGSTSSPQGKFSVAEWQKQAKEKIADIVSRGKLPIVCGGTGFYLQSVVDNVVLPEVPPNNALRKKLEKKSVEELFIILNKLDPKRAKTIDSRNPVRLVRAIEIATKLGKVPGIAKQKTEYEMLQIGLTLPGIELKEKIHTRLLVRIKKGMVSEVRKLHDQGLSWKRLESLGLEYRYVAMFLQKKATNSEFIQKLETEIWQYAKRQVTWFKRDKNINWFSPKEGRKIEKLVDNFLHK